MGSEGDKASPIPGDPYGTQEQDAEIYEVSAASKAALEDDETSYSTGCLPGCHPAQHLYNVGRGNEKRRVWTLSDQMTMHLTDPMDPEGWEEQLRFWNPHIDLHNEQRMLPNRAFGSECYVEEHPQVKTDSVRRIQPESFLGPDWRAYEYLVKFPPVAYPPTAYPTSAYPPSDLLRTWQLQNKEKSGTGTTGSIMDNEDEASRTEIHEVTTAMSGIIMDTRTEETLASALESPDPIKCEKSSEHHPGISTNMPGQTEGKDSNNNMNGFTHLETGKESISESKKKQKKKKKNKNKSKSKAVQPVQPVEFDGPWAYVLRDLVPILNSLCLDSLEILDRELKLIEFHCLILKTLRSIGNNTDQLTDFADDLEAYQIIVRSNNYHFIQGAHILICLGGRQGGAQKIEKLLTEKDLGELEKLQGLPVNGYHSEWAFLQNKTQHWSPVVWYWVLRSTISRSYQRGTLKRIVKQPDFTEE